ncbi:EamA family transporter [Streptomyces flavofungini]|uniref:EamA family transporter n=1 Tax=Streptomyces flavofungini TaxID=68200 RepID=UPI0025B2769B|nr:EamA family transporter [Streptomyces flavofungini]WJV50839.1 EamA family transporter [Streptomyces flavofungini]
MTYTRVQAGAAAAGSAVRGTGAAGPAAAGPGGARPAGTASTTGRGAPAAGGIRKATGPASAGSLGGIGLVLAGVLSVQFGSAAAALLFPRAGALGVVALRVTIAAVLLLVVCRPRLRGHSRKDWGVVGAFGLALGGMNVLFYQAIDRIPLGPAVTLEVLGPLLLSVVTARRAASLVWAAMAFAGVFLLGQGSFGELSATGAGFALGAGAMWAAYIVFSSRAGARFPRLDGLALAMAVAALVSLPLGIGAAGATLVEPKVLAIGLVVALLSSGVPYTLELLALRRLPAATFAVLMSLAPAVAALAGFLVLGQTLSALQCVAIALVVGASAGAVRAGGAGRK